MNSLVITMAKAVAEMLNGVTITGETLSAGFRLVVERSIATSKTLRVISVPHELKSSIAGRGNTRDRTVTVDIGLMKRCSEQELEHLVEVTEGIGDYLEGRRIGDIGRCVAVNYSPIYDSDIFLQQSCFFSLISIDVRVLG